MENLIFSPLLPSPVLVLATLAGIGVLLWGTIRKLPADGWRWFLLCLRLLLLGLLVLFLFQVRWKEEIRRELPQLLAVVVDDTQSMTDPADPSQPLRSERVKSWLRSDAVARIATDYQIRFYRFQGNLEEWNGDLENLSFQGSRSNLQSSLASLLRKTRGQPVAGVLLFADGISPEKTTRALSEGQEQPLPPVFVFVPEEEFVPGTPPVHLELSGVDFPARALTGRAVEIRARVTARNFEGKAVDVELWQDGSLLSESVVAFTTRDQTRQSVFTVQSDTPGTKNYQVRLVSPEDQPAPHSKELPVRIDFLTPGNRILYLQNTLGFDFRFLRRALTGDRNLTLSSYVRWQDGQLVEIGDSGRGSGSPVNFQKDFLRTFSVILLGDLPPDLLKEKDYQEIAEFVSDGGGLVLLGGPNLLASDALARTPLKDLLPVTLPAAYEEGEFPVSITDTGIRHPVFGPLFSEMERLPPLLSRNRPTGTALSAEVLLQTSAGTGGDTAPLVASMRFGEGRVVVVLSDTIWRWRMASSGWTSSASPYDTFWKQLVDWMLPKSNEASEIERLELFSTENTYHPGDTTVIRAIYHGGSESSPRPASIPLRLFTPDQRVLEYEMQPATFPSAAGREIEGYSLSVDPIQPGMYRALASLPAEGRFVESEFVFHVVPPPNEKTGEPVSISTLATIAEQTGGKLLRPSQWNEDFLSGLPSLRQEIVRTVSRDLWSSPWLLLLFLGLIFCEWLIRKRRNLP